MQNRGLTKTIHQHTVALAVLVGVAIATSVVALIVSLTDESTGVSSSIIAGQQTINVHTIQTPEGELNGISFHSRGDGQIQTGMYSYKEKLSTDEYFVVYTGNHQLDFFGNTNYQYVNGSLQAFQNHEEVTCIPIPAYSVRVRSGLCPKPQVGIAHRNPNHTLAINGTLSVSGEATFDSSVSFNGNVSVVGTLVVEQDVIVNGSPIHGIQGLSCWDLNQNAECDLAQEDTNGDNQCSVLDCRGADGVNGNNGLSCWDLNNDGVCNIAQEDRNADGQCNAFDCQGEDGQSGFSCWDINMNYACDLATEDKDANGVCNTQDCQGINGTGAYNCWDLNENNICNLLSEDTNNDGQCSVLDCRINIPDSFSFSLALVNNGWSTNTFMTFRKINDIVIGVFYGTNGGELGTTGVFPTFTIPNDYIPEATRTVYLQMYQTTTVGPSTVYSLRTLGVTLNPNGSGSMAYFDSSGTKTSSWPLINSAVTVQTFTYTIAEPSQG